MVVLDLREAYDLVVVCHRERDTGVIREIDPVQILGLLETGARHHGLLLGDQRLDALTKRSVVEVPRGVGGLQGREAVVIQIPHPAQVLGGPLDGA